MTISQDLFNEINQIVGKDLSNFGVDPEYTGLEPENISIIANFTSGCPGWCGSVAFCLHDCGCCITILRKDRSSNDQWYVSECMQEGKLLIRNNQGGFAP